ncbi:phenoloxidase 1-like [Venturia canescens]|uniref:phenoloxidase 1-like n=1 Tax=Venturia canescens TaxID=32260 RepID=UPI001C9C2A69|nr:phenoloxidase 1-like [Venturia canescens]
MDNIYKRSILSLLERPCEPVFVPRGRDNVCFDFPPEYMPERFKPYATELLDRFSEGTVTRIQVRDVPIPDLSFPLELERDEQFSLFFPKHRRMAASLVNSLMDLKNFDELLSVATCSRDHLNQQMFFYALCVTLLHRHDTKDLQVPSLFEIYPASFFGSAVFPKLKEQAKIVSESSRVPIEISRNYTANDLEPENRLAYFREDIGVNSHHWHWHVVYPHSPKNIEVVDKDRRGELFYWMHQQVLGRYNIARLCAKLGRVKKIKSFEDPKAEAYFPKLNPPEASGTWASRPKGCTPFQDLNRPAEEAFYKLEDIKRWIDRIYLAIHTGQVRSEKGGIIELTVDKGIDILGNMIEASDLSPNPKLYGDIHNAGHAMISCCHDPDGRHLESYGAMGNVTTAMRDPFFYRWHTLIDDIFYEYKNTLPEYTDAELSFPGIEITAVGLTTPDASANTLLTFWSKSMVDVSRGLDYEPQGDLLVKFTHLNHANFKYHFTVLNTGNSAKIGTVRIFIGPKLDERELPFVLRSQMRLMIAMDKFVVTFQPGENYVERASSQSSLTISFDTIYREVEENLTLHNDERAFNFCGCGWPHYLLVPIGDEGGYPMEMFVMISDHADDLVEQPSPTGCSDAATFCGLRDRKYPDARAMGYPFDRKPPTNIDTLAAFLKPNMALTDITVKFTDTYIPRSDKTA